MPAVHPGRGRDRPPRSVPRATYRVQLNNAFRFTDAQAIVDYLSALGVSHFYSSPLLVAKRGSLHCYDVVRHDTLNPDIGSRKEFDSFVRRLAQEGMGLLLDTVPNHMSVSDENPLWMSVLEHGPYSPHSGYFDIRWPRDGRVVLPVLADEFSKVLGSDDLEIQFDSETATFHLLVSRGLLVPLTLRSYADVLQIATEAEVGPSAEGKVKLSQLIQGFRAMPSPSKSVPTDEAAELLAAGLKSRRRLRKLCLSDASLLSSIASALLRINDKRGASLMSSILAAQFYRLIYWRNAAREIDYRRFLNLNDYIAIRQEEASVFAESHRLTMELVLKHQVTGLRVDHPDGLLDPSQYFQRLRSGADRSRRASKAGTPLYVVAEKILRKEEQLQEDWSVQGTTGYDFLNLVNSLFVVESNAKVFDQIHAEFTGRRMNFDEVSRTARRRVIARSMVADLRYLAKLLGEVSKRIPKYRALSLKSLEDAIAEVAACFPVYRTYLSARRPLPNATERRQLGLAISQASRAEHAPDEGALDLLRETMLRPTAAARDQSLAFVLRFQQFTPAVTVKGVEDTAFYRYNRLTSLNEVGGDPEDFGVSVDSFHEANIRRATTWPLSMLASSTHDTKRSEDVRARINVLSEMPQEWRSALSRWSAINVAKKSVLDIETAPSADDEYLLYQTLLGAWPLDREELPGFVERMVAYMVKASKESKRRTSWVFPSQGYDNALERFVRLILREGDNPFLADLAAMEAKVSYFGMINSLSQLVLKLTCPGIPDVYQGTELWDFSLVDPDNRRPVDFVKRSRMLADLKARTGSASVSGRAALVRDLLSRPEDGRVKMFVLHATLAYRRGHEDLFTRGAYIPVACSGPKRRHVCAFARKRGRETVLVVAPRFFASLDAERWPLDDPKKVWGGTKLILGRGFPMRFENLFTAELVKARSQGRQHVLELEDVVRSFPVALLRVV